MFANSTTSSSARPSAPPSRYIYNKAERKKRSEEETRVDCGCDFTRFRSRHSSATTIRLSEKWNWWKKEMKRRKLSMTTESSLYFPFAFASPSRHLILLLKLLCRLNWNQAGVELAEVVDAVVLRVVRHNFIKHHKKKAEKTLSSTRHCKFFGALDTNHIFPSSSHCCHWSVLCVCDSSGEQQHALWHSFSVDVSSSSSPGVCLCITHLLKQFHNWINARADVHRSQRAGATIR